MGSVARWFKIFNHHEFWHNGRVLYWWYACVFSCWLFFSFICLFSYSFIHTYLSLLIHLFISSFIDFYWSIYFVIDLLKHLFIKYSIIFFILSSGDLAPKDRLRNAVCLSVCLSAHQFAQSLYCSLTWHRLRVPAIIKFIQRHIFQALTNIPNLQNPSQIQGKLSFLKVLAHNISQETLDTFWLTLLRKFGICNSNMWHYRG